MPETLTATPTTTPATTLTPYLVCRDAHDAIAFYAKALDAKAVSVFPHPDGRVMHATLKVDGATFYLCDEFPEYGSGLAPQSPGRAAVTLHLQVPDCDAVYNRAVEGGCTVTMPMENMFWGDRYGAVTDPYGHQWSIATHIRTVTPEEMQRAAEQMFGNS